MTPMPNPTYAIPPDIVNRLLPILEPLIESGAARIALVSGVTYKRVVSMTVTWVPQKELPPLAASKEKATDG